MAYILGANNQQQAKSFVTYLARATNTSKGSSIVQPERRITPAYPVSTTVSETSANGVILGTLVEGTTVQVIYDSAGEYTAGNHITVSMLSAVYGSYLTPGINVVVFRAQIGSIGGGETA